MQMSGWLFLIWGTDEVPTPGKMSKIWFHQMLVLLWGNFFQHFARHPSLLKADTAKAHDAPFASAMTWIQNEAPSVSKLPLFRWFCWDQLNLEWEWLSKFQGVTFEIKRKVARSADQRKCFQAVQCSLGYLAALERDQKNCGFLLGGNQRIYWRVAWQVFLLRWGIPCWISINSALSTKQRLIHHVEVFSDFSGCSWKTDSCFQRKYQFDQ